MHAAVHQHIRQQLDKRAVFGSAPEPIQRIAHFQVGIEESHPFEDASPGEESLRYVAGQRLRQAMIAEAFPFVL
jgi:hypothetical protein